MNNDTLVKFIDTPSMTNEARNNFTMQVNTLYYTNLYVGSNG